VKTVLVIDDDVSTRTIVRSFLEKAGFTVYEAEDGKAGIKLFMEHPADLVVVDIFMPEKDGIETISDILGQSQGCKILAISGGGAMNNLDMLRFSKILGAGEILVKPFSRTELLAAVERLGV